jgi:polyhydroxyalkanoate synthesis regulator phasin
MANAFNISFEEAQKLMNNMIKQSKMTFDPSIDCRNDLINHYGYTRQQVSNMSDDELFSIMDRIESQEKGYGYDEYEEHLPEVYKNEKCKCGGTLKVLYVDCETRGDCEIYVCEKCKKETYLHHAEEWFE